MDRKSLVFIAMGVEAVGVIMACLYLGQWLDQKYGWGGYGAPIGALIGLIGWVVHLLAVAQTITQSDSQSLAKKDNSGDTDEQ